MDNKLNLIIDKLESKACLKQDIYRVCLNAFNELRDICEKLSDEINENMHKDVDEKVRPIFFKKNEFEFHLKISGDTLVFQMHTNIVTLNPEDKLFKSPYVKKDPSRAYFGSIRVYDFLSDSIKYNRFHDAGILLARLLINKESHYHIESGVQFTSLQQTLSKNKLSDRSMRFFIENAIISAIDIDLIAPGYKDIQVISLQDHEKNNMGDAGSKLGFQMKYGN